MVLKTSRFTVAVKESGPLSSIFLPEAYCSKHNILPHSQLELRVGGTSFRVTARTGVQSDRRLHLSRDIAEAVSLRSRRLWVTRTPDGTLRIACVLAILVAEPSRKTGPIFGPVTDYLREIFRRAPRYGIWVYLVHPDVLLDGLQAGSVKSFWRWNRKLRRWEHLNQPVPLPNVIYDRIGRRNVDQSFLVERLRNRLNSEYNEKYFNPGFFDKWMVHSLLSRNRKLVRHLPVTSLSSDLAWRRTALREDVFFVKPISGSQGIGIARFRRLARGKWSYFWVKQGVGVKRGKISGLKNLLNFRQMHFPEDQYIVQKGVRLARAGGYPFDLRILLQKGKSGRWRIASRVARVATRKGALTNIARGARPATWREVFRLSGLGKTARARVRLSLAIRRMALRVAKGLERAMGRPLGELGVDIAIDRSGRLWLLEANAKPGHQMSDEKRKRFFSIPYLLRYCLYLSDCETGKVRSRRRKR